MLDWAVASHPILMPRSISAPESKILVNYQSSLVIIPKVCDLSFALFVYDYSY